MKKNGAPSGGSRPNELMRQRWLGWTLLLAMIGLVVAVVVKSRSLSPSPQTASGQSVQPASAPAGAALSFKKLEGRWLRPDGGYVLEIKRAGEEGRLEAAYYNPQPIQVARAQASRLGSYVKVEVELRDVGYPGCLYTLLWEPGREDILRGTYYQAALRETYDIQFERLKEKRFRRGSKKRGPARGRSSKRFQGEMPLRITPR
ncbi:MAG: hypothetical protein N3J91_07595 [Verrucomicrobiae bacterium]|nr:hypothetical protein [Verrucomicrobiae bacterium]